MESAIKRPKLSDKIVEKLETLILQGSIKAGERLPPERELAKEFGVSRPSLREAIQKLGARGLVRSRQGGGTYVVDNIGTSFSDPLLALLDSHPEVHFDLLEYRHTIEGDCAYYAAMRATDEDKLRIRDAYEELQRSYEEEELEREAAADARFHLSIAEASHNMVLFHTVKGLFDLLKHNVITNIGGMYGRRETRYNLKKQHDALFDAVIASDPDRAREAIQVHLSYVERTLADLKREEERLNRGNAALAL
ncbi:FCD domain-containing protein [Aestuariirhabdus sp. LZHN29]|uniref:FCD domain-containing protein n=1 Tax=Aestuariirhabdus sp. LZHN29 TaxID=3417462 RepID=UPI003CF2302F